MRKSQFHRLNNYIQIFEKLHDVIDISLRAENTDINVLGESIQTAQNMAIEMGTFIEECEGLGHITVTHLEEYCELVYDVYEKAERNENISANNIQAELEAQLNIIKTSVENDIKIKKLVIFLPYKASMWDCFESVWEAANDDLECEALVIPIPYYKKNSKGEAIELVYEGELYPDNVPIVDYKEFDYENERPDAIYVHYPYDGRNLVTSILPFFYSDNLKKYTDCLVYIPYYASAGAVSDHFAYMPSYDNYDYIVLQSEAAKKYTSIKVSDEKLLALGSPKFDSIINKCKNPNVPLEEWREKLQGKKVFFFNTSISGMLQNADIFLNKMEYVFDVFKQHKECCLIWRPHPLLENTIDTICPEYKERYVRIRDEYIKSGFGIYDTTPSIEDTIALCDAYVGDAGTSVTALFGVTGKEIFILDNNIDVRPTEDDIRAVAYYAPRRDYKVNYMVLPGRNQLYKRDKNNIFKYYADIDEYSQGWRYQGAVDYNGKIFVIPSSSRDIIIIGEDGSRRIITTPDDVEPYSLFASYFKLDNKVIIFPNRHNRLIILDMDKESIRTVDGIGELNVMQLPSEERVPAARWIIGNRIYILGATGKAMLVIDLDANKVTVEEININRLMIGAVSEEKNSKYYWLLPENGTKVIRMDMDTYKYEEYDLMTEGLISYDRMYHKPCNRRYFLNCIKSGNGMIFAPNWGNMFVRLDLATGVCSEYETEFDCSYENINCYNVNNGIGYFVPNEQFGEIQYFSAKEKQAYDIDVDTMTFTRVSEKVDLKDVIEHEAGFSKFATYLQYCCNENVFNSLEDLLNGTIHGKKHSKEDTIRAFEYANASPNGDCGAKIHREIMSRI